MSQNKAGFQFVRLLGSFLCLLLLFPNLSRAADGDQIWAFTTGGRVVSSPAIDTNGTLYVGSGDNNLYAINPDGTQKWTFLTGGLVYSSPAIGLGNTIYLGSGDHRVYAVNPDGTLKWVFDTNGSVESSPAIGSDGTIYVGSYDNFLYAINPDGSQKWAFETGGDVYSSPAIGSDGMVYVGSQDRNLYAINPDGTQKWAFETGDYVYSSPAIGSDGTIYAGSWDTRLYAINPDTGVEQWAFQTQERVHSSPAIGSDGTIYVGSGDGNFYAVNPDGTPKWAFETGGSVESSPAIGADGTIYVGSQDGNLYAINADGTLKWTFETGNRVQSSPAVTDGTIYWGSHDNRLHAIEGSSGGLVDSSWPKFRHDSKGTGLWMLISDTTPPTVSATDPADNATGVDPREALTATFSEAMLPSTISTDTFIVRQGSAIVEGDVIYSGATATFTPETDLDYEEVFTATITVGAQDLAGNPLEFNHVWAFTTGSNPDAVPPTVSATLPADNSTGVDVSTAVLATFSEAMNPSSITAATFLVNDGTGNIAGAVSCSGATATFAPTTSLDYQTDYMVTITTGVEDLAGNALQADYSWTFATGLPPDVVPPTVDSTSPDDNATDVGLNTAIAVTFSEGMDVSTIDGTTFFVNDGTSYVAGTVNCNGAIAVFTPETILNYETDYTATITTGARDLAGNALQSDYIWTFTTEEAPPPAISVIPTSFSNSCLSGESPSSDSFELWNSGGGILDYIVTDDVGWLSCVPASGTSTGEHDTVAIDYEVSELDPGAYSATITISASGASNSPATIPVTLVVGPHAPIADAGPDQRVSEGETVTLDGSNSADMDDGIFSYRWQQTAGPDVELSDEIAVQPTFIAPDEGLDGESLTFQLTVADNGGLESTDTCIVNVTNDNEPPVADAGLDLKVGGGVPVTLDGDGSDDLDGSIASYLWEQTAGPLVALSVATAPQVEFTAPEEGADGVSLTFRLTVTDNGGLQSTDTCIVNVTSENEPPEAHAGPDQIVDEGDTVTLDASDSTDVEDDIVASYLWTQTSGIPVTLSVTTAAHPTFVAPPVSGVGTELELTFQVTVTDFAGLQASDEVSVTVDDNEIGGFPEDVITLLASTGEDLGMEVLDGGSCTSLYAVDPSTISDNTNRPGDLIYGLIDLQIKAHTVGGAVDVTIHLPNPAPDGYRWYKYGSSGWFDFSGNTVFNANRTQLTLSLVDGGVGDDDGTANGIIVDPSGLGTPPSGPASPTISQSPASLSNTCEEGQDAPSQDIEIWNSGGGTISYSISDDAVWLSCTPASGSSTGEHDTITVDYVTSGLASGTYSATITISAPGASNTPQTIPVSLTVTAPSNSQPNTGGADNGGGGGGGGGCFIGSAVFDFHMEPHSRTFEGTSKN